MVFECNEFVRRLQMRRYLFSSIELLFSFFDVDYFTALKSAGLSVDAVRHLCFASIFIKVELRRAQSIVCTAGACTGM